MTNTSKDFPSLAESARYSGDPWAPKNPYFAQAEAGMEGSWSKLIWPVIKDCDFTTVVDLAAGHGRNSAKLLEHAGSLIVMDIQTGNVEVCRERFKDHSNVTTMVCSGFDLTPIPNNIITLVYCFDAMVHFNPDVVQSYLRDTYRVLKPGGQGFFHHSNHTAGDDWRTNPGGRNFMSAELFKQHSEEAGLTVAHQQVIDWGARPKLDCLTLVRKP